MEHVACIWLAHAGKKPAAGLPRRKSTVLLLIVACLLTASTGSAQKITLSVENAPLERVFGEIKKQAGYFFIYNTQMLQRANNVSVHVTDMELAAVLQLCFQDQPLGWEIENNTVIVTRRRNSGSANPMVVPEFSGTVTDEAGEALEAVTIEIKSSGKKTITDASGYFTIKGTGNNEEIIILSGVGYETKTLILLNGKRNELQLKRKPNQLAEVTVNASSGYQQLVKARSTGSMDVIDNNLLTRSSAPNILDRIENLTPGVLFDRTYGNQDKLLVRGRSTIYSNEKPLIVLDNFPYDGNISNINPNDIESITVLKDAAAASIWGVRAGNGVIVITSKKGRSGNPKIELLSNSNFQDRPDLKNIHTLTATEFVELEKYLFANDAYSLTELLNQLGLPYSFSPVVELLIAKRDGTINAAGADQEIEAFKKNNAQDEVSRYLYQPSFGQQHALNISGNTPYINYYLSVGYDYKKENLVSQHTNRINITNGNTFKLTQKFQVETSLRYSENNFTSGNNPGYLIGNHSTTGLLPYTKLRDENGNALAIVQDVRYSFIDAARQKGLQDWYYRPLDDIDKVNNHSKIKDLLASAAFRYVMTSYLNLELRYQYENSTNTTQNYFHADSYYARNLINLYAQTDPLTGAITRPVPPGGMIDNLLNEGISSQARGQVNFSKRFGQHQLTAISGAEIKNFVTTENSYPVYGYNENGSYLSSNIDFNHFYTLYTDPYTTAPIPNQQKIQEKTDRLVSYYLNAQYSMQDRYFISGSGRVDASNLFGVATRHKKIPLWSGGIAWEIDKESFYKIGWLPYFKLRTSYGVQGNYSRAASAYTTAQYSTDAQTGLLQGKIITPPNQNLRWETVAIWNTGIDFATTNRRISGNIDYYKKRSTDLMGTSPIDATVGLADEQPVSFFFGNIASMAGEGLDLQLEFHLIDQNFKWTLNLLSSYNNMRITRYYLPVSASGRDYATGSIYNPVAGNPLFSLYSYKWAGLEPATGDPKGELHKVNTTDYAALISETPLSEMIYSGNIQPKIFGAVRNTFGWKGISLSVNIGYKLKYFFRKKSVQYQTLYNQWFAGEDYSLRWQKPGDEKTTSVPSRSYPPDYNRDFFYANSEILIRKADHMRLEDLQLSWKLNAGILKHLPFKEARIYLQAMNPGILWAANKEKIDPYFQGIPKPSKTFTTGFVVSL